MKREELPCGSYYVQGSASEPNPRWVRTLAEALPPQDGECLTAVSDGDALIITQTWGGSDDVHDIGACRVAIHFGSTGLNLSIIPCRITGRELGHQPAVEMLWEHPWNWLRYPGLPSIPQCLLLLTARCRAAYLAAANLAVVNQ